MHILLGSSLVSSLSNLNAKFNSNFWQCFCIALENVILKWNCWTKLVVGKMSLWLHGIKYCNKCKVFNGKGNFTNNDYFF